MPYTIRFTDDINKGSIVVEDREINTTDTSLQFPGKQATAYGAAIGENFLHLLENFASNNPPSNPVEGQTWYDTNIGVDQLKVYDGTNWVAAGGLKKGTLAPEIGNSVLGDLWVNTDNQQLYLNNGASWVLVGPEFSAGLASGIRAEQILGQDNNLYTVLLVDIGDAPMAIFSKEEFLPKKQIVGFSRTISPGINLSNATGFKYYGTAASAESLIVSDQSTPVDANNFLRGDAESTTTSLLRAKSNDGIQVGENGQLALEASGNAGVIRSNVSGASLDIKVKSSDGNLSTAIRANPDSNVGINKENPQVSLDVNGTIQSDTGVKVDGIEDANRDFNDVLTEGSIVTSGGATVAKHIKVGDGATIRGGIQVDGDITTNPDATQSPNISGFEKISATTFEGNLKGSVTGTIEGSASSASKLTNKTKFEMTGDVSAESFTFDGAGETTKTFTTTLSPDFISTKTTTLDIQDGDQLLINRTLGDEPGLYRITQTNLIKNIPKNPIGMIVPFAGINIPDGWLLCDGSIVLKTDALELFKVIQHQFKDAAAIDNLPDVNSNTHFGLPDFRGRFLLGSDNMGGNPANRVTGTGADIVGRVSGSEEVDIKKENLPAHTHDLKSDNTQFYALIDSDAGQEIGIEIGTGASASPNSGEISGGGIDGDGGYRTVDGEDLGSALNIMPPYQTVNYIIFADNA